MSLHLQNGFLECKNVSLVSQIITTLFLILPFLTLCMHSSSVMAVCVSRRHRRSLISPSSLVFFSCQYSVSFSFLSFVLLPSYIYFSSCLFPFSFPSFFPLPQLRSDSQIHYSPEPFMFSPLILHNTVFGEKFFRSPINFFLSKQKLRQSFYFFFIFFTFAFLRFFFFNSCKFPPLYRECCYSSSSSPLIPSFFSLHLWWNLSYRTSMKVVYVFLRVAISLFIIWGRRERRDKRGKKRNIKTAWCRRGREQMKGGLMANGRKAEIRKGVRGEWRENW